jgi:hypothetical protein
MSNAKDQPDKAAAIIDLMVISEIMAALGASPTVGDEVPASWVAFLGCAVGEAAHRLAKD